jgi:hypothetical protein
MTFCDRINTRLYRESPYVIVIREGGYTFSSTVALYQQQVPVVSHQSGFKKRVV